MRFAITAATVARDRAAKSEHTEITLRNMDKVTRFRKGGQKEFEKMVQKVASLGLGGGGRDAETATENK